MADSPIPNLQTTSIAKQESSLLIATAPSDSQNPLAPVNASGGNQDLGLVFDAASRQWSVTTQQVQHLVLEEIYQGCIQARDDLLETANKYRKKANEPPIDATATHTWNEVDEGVQSACHDLEKLVAHDRKKVAGATGRVRQAFRSLCRHAGAGQTAISLIPGDVFGFSSVLCAGFKVIFSAMHQAALYRDELFRALEELPSLLKDSSELCNSIIFEDNEDLHQRRAELYTAVFQALKHILLWFLKNSLVTSVKLLVDPTGFADKLKEHMDSVKLRSQLFQSQAIKLSLLLQAQTARLQVLTTQDVQTIATQTARITSETLQTKAATLGMLEKLDSLVRGIPSPQPPPPQALPLPSSSTGKGKSSRRKSKSPASQSATNALLRDLCYDPSVLSTDVSSLLRLLLPSRRQSGSDGDFDEARVVAIQSNPRMRAWLVLNQPSMLLLNARASTRPKSEASLVNAKIAGRLLEVYETQEMKMGRGEPVVLPLVFFCGEHRDWGRDPNGNAAELAMALLLQLMDRGREVITKGVLERVRATVVPEDIGAICDALEMAVDSLEGNVFVVIVVDGLRFFAQPPVRRVQTKQVVERLVAMFRGRPKATMKVLFTTTTRLEAFEGLFDDDEVLNLQRDLPGTGPDNDRRWKGAVDMRIADG